MRSRSRSFVWVTLLAISGKALAGSPEEGHHVAACGPACYAIVLRLLDRPVRSYELQSLASGDGTCSLESLRTLARQDGLFAEGVSLSVPELVATKRLAILHMQIPDDETDASRQHFVVFAGAPSDDEVVLIDPTPGSPFHGRVDRAMALQFWSGRALLISSRPLAFTVTPRWWVVQGVEAFCWWVAVPLTLIVAPWLVVRAMKSRKTVQ